MSATSNYKFTLTGAILKIYSDIRVMVVPQGSSENEKLFVRYGADFEAVLSVSSTDSGCCFLCASVLGKRQFELNKKLEISKRILTCNFG